MKKIDLRKQFRHLYHPSAKEVEFVDVPLMSFLMVDGAGDPNTSPEFQEAMQALYAVSYTLKFTVKKGPMGLDYPVMALEGLWWREDMRQFSPKDKAAWQWTLMIMQPEFITAQLVAEATAQVQEKRNPPALSRLRFERLHEGLSAQIMHLGPYSAEGPTIRKLHAFIKDNGCDLRGKHHEIYLSDPRRAKPERMKTVLRQPAARPGR